MVVTPDSDIFILKSPLQIDNKNQLTFTNATAQYNYFSSLTKMELEDATYMRKDGVLRYDGNFEDIVTYNYCMYKNTHYKNKWFYAYIIGMEYKNDNCTYIYLKSDVWQTWQFDLTFKASYIEREMLSSLNDTPGANLVPENLETGEYKVGATATFTELEPYYIVAYASDTLQFVVLGTSTDPANLSSIAEGHQFSVNGIPNSVYFICCTTLAAYSNLTIALSGGNQSEHIVAAFTVPNLATTGIKYQMKAKITGTTNYTNIADTYVLGGKATATTKTLTSTPTTLDGYQPKNAKLRQYPFMYLGYNPVQGSSKIFRYEDFTNGTPSFKIISEVNPNPSVYFIPQNYRGKTGDSMSDLASLNGYPQLATRVDIYNSWLAENSGIINVQAKQAETNAIYDINSSTVSMFTGIANMFAGGINGGVGGIASGFTGTINSAQDILRTTKNYDYYIQSINAQKERQQMLPDNVTLGGSNATLLGYELLDDNIFTRYTIKSQFAKRVDDFFTMYGYATNELKIPNLNNRSNWNYVKTAGANIIGDVPETDLQEIKALFNEGITLWHTTTYFLDYSQNNT